jgi:transcriptional regulator with GAF, ATPase, and Fis domain
MTEPTTPGAPNLAEQLAAVKKGFDTLEEVLNALFESYAKQGIKPTYHLTAALDKMRKGITDANLNSKQIQRHLDQLAEVVRTAALITSSLELDEVLDDVMDTVVQLTGAERAYLMMYDEQNALQTRAARNWDKQTINQQDAQFSQGIVDAAIKQGVPIITTNAQADERFQSRESISVQQLRSIICIPLSMRGQTIGVLYADNRFKKDLFSEDMVPVLTAFGTQASIAINNARRYGQVKENLAVAQAEIDRLRIEIDKKRLDTQVGEIVGSEYFQKLSETAKAKREQRQTGERKAAKQGDAVTKDKDKKK